MVPGSFWDGGGSSFHQWRPPLTCTRRGLPSLQVLVVEDQCRCQKYLQFRLFIPGNSTPLTWEGSGRPQWALAPSPIVLQPQLCPVGCGLVQSLSLLLSGPGPSFLKEGDFCVFFYLGDAFRSRGD